MHAMGGGIETFFKGFEANLVGRLSYLAIRNSLYLGMYNQLKPVKMSNDLTNREKALLGGFAGGVAALITTPFVLINIR